LNEGTWIVIIGLVFDVFGAFLIVSPLMNYMRKRVFKDEKGHKIIDYEPKQFVTEDPKKEYLIQTKVRIGFILLAVGFILQIFGNWVQNPPLN